MAGDPMFAPLGKADLSGESKPQSRQSSKPADWQPLWPVPPDHDPPPDVHPAKGKPTARWTYRSASGEVGFYVCRFDHPDGSKEILPLTYCENANGVRSWRWKGMDPLRPLYNLDQLDRFPNRTVIVTEGEKAADAAARLFPDMVATTSPNGAKAAGKAGWTALANRIVVIWPDADPAGLAYADAVLAQLEAAQTKDIRFILPPSNAPLGWDAADLEAEPDATARATALLNDATRGRAGLDALQKAHGNQSRPMGTPSAREDNHSEGGRENRRARRANDGEDGGRGPSQRDQLMTLGREADLWRSPDGKAYATLFMPDSTGGHLEHHAIRRPGFRNWLTLRFLDEHGAAPGSSALEEALNTLQALALRGPCFEPGLRVMGKWNGRDLEQCFIDLCDDQWRVIEIGRNGWRVVTYRDVDHVPVRFIRAGRMAALPEPVIDDRTIDELISEVFNTATNDDGKLIAAWLIAAFRPRGPYPIMVFIGEQGSGKSEATRLARRIIDPNAADLRQPPKDARDLQVSAMSNHVLTIDNVSGFSGELSDALCRVATGGGYASRKLHSDDEEEVLSAERPIVANGITDFVKRPDLMNRSLFPALAAIAEGKRRYRDELRDRFDELHPAILNALCNGLVAAIRNGPTTVLSRVPRMADFEKLIAAAEPGLGWEPGSFSELYARNRDDAAKDLLDDHPLVKPLSDLVAEQPFEGSSDTLLEQLSALAPEHIRRSQHWPKSTGALGNSLSRIQPELSKVGLSAERVRLGKNRTRGWRVKRTA